MPRLSHRLPSYRKHRASGQAVVTLNGRDFYLGTHGTKASRAEYDRLCGEYLASGGAIAGEHREAITVVELLSAFWKHAQEYYGRASSEPHNYRTLIKRLRTIYGKTPVDEFGPLKLKAFRQSLIDGKLSRTYVNHSINRVRHIFKWGVENELVKPQIFDALKCVGGLRFGKSKAKETEPIKPVADWVVDATLAHCSPQVAAMIGLQRVTGMRSGEVSRMRTADINTQGAVWIYTPSTHKTLYRGHSRIVFLGPKAQEILRPWLRPKLHENLFQPCEAEAWRREQMRKARKTPLSCGNRPGSNRQSKPRKKPRCHYATDTYLRAVKYAIDKCNRQRKKQGEQPIPSWHPHQLRHNAATFYRREYGLEVARVLLGHKHAAITEIYAEADQTRAVEVMAKIG